LSDIGKGKVALVTGAGRGLGREFAEMLAQDGYRVVVADLDADNAQSVAEGLTAKGAEAQAVKVDVADEDSVQAMADAVRERFGTVHVLLNNAGIFGDHTFRPVLEETIEYWNKIMAVNLNGPLLCTRAVAPMMKEQGWGRVVNMSSMGAYTNAGVYSISKLALNSLTWCMAAELGDFGITVNAVAPGTMDTESSYRQHPNDEWRVRRAAATIIKRTGKAFDIYAAIKYFISDESDWCTAQTLVVNGGYSVHL
jgi:NAD(P)-dependent dehydrogenase (short-subunit alcohol dehydrogenase family)